MYTCGGRHHVVLSCIISSSLAFTHAHFPPSTVTRKPASHCNILRIIYGRIPNVLSTIYLHTCRKTGWKRIWTWKNIFKGTLIADNYYNPIILRGLKASIVCVCECLSLSHSQIQYQNTFYNQIITILIFQII